MRKLALCLFLITCSTWATAEEVSPAPFALSLISDDLEHPVAIVSTPSEKGRAFIVERGGTVEILKDGKLTGDQLLDLSNVVHRTHPHGLMAVAFHPDFERNRIFFAYFVDVNGDSIVALFHANATTPPDENSLLVTIKFAQSFPNEYGGSLAFGPDRLLFVGTSNGGPNPAAAKLMNNLFGKVLRISPKDEGGYTIPTDNPSRKVPDTDGEIWASGFLSPDSLMLNATTGSLFALNSHAPTGDTVSLVRSGAVLGDGPAYTAPRGETLVGGVVYQGSELPALTGKLILADAKSGTIFSLVESGGAWTRDDMLKVPRGHVSAVGCDPHGELLVATDAGEIFSVTAKR